MSTKTKTGHTGGRWVRVLGLLCFFAWNFTGNLTGGLTGSLTGNPGWATTITQIRMAERDNGYRLVVVLDRPSPWKIQSLPNPDRLIIDLPSGPFEAQAGLERILQNYPFLSGYREGNFGANIDRIVLDFTQPFRLKKAALLRQAGRQQSRLYMDFALQKAQTPRALPFAQSDDWRDTPPEVAPLNLAPKTGGRKHVAIDPGHGGIDPGALDRTKKWKEKDIVLAFALDLERALKRKKNLVPIMTRRSDTAIPLRRRFELAERHKADLFVSLHADAFPVRRLQPRVRGLTVYTLSERGSSREATQLAARENQADLLAGVNLQAVDSRLAPLLVGLAQEEMKKLSTLFANRLITLSRKNKFALSKEPLRSANFAVLKSPNVPSVLVELGYLTNQADLRNLTSRGYRQLYAETLADAIEHYLQQNP